MPKSVPTDHIYIFYVKQVSLLLYQFTGRHLAEPLYDHSLNNVFWRQKKLKKWFNS